MNKTDLKNGCTHEVYYVIIIVLNILLLSVVYTTYTIGVELLNYFIDF